MADLSTFSARQKQSLSLVAEAAIAAFVSPEQTGDAVLRRLTRMDRALQKLERDNAISSEALLVFVWNWLLATPAVPESPRRRRGLQQPSAMMPSWTRLAATSLRRLSQANSRLPRTSPAISRHRHLTPRRRVTAGVQINGRDPFTVIGCSSSAYPRIRRWRRTRRPLSNELSNSFPVAGKDVK